MKKTLAALTLALSLLTVSAAAFSDVDDGLYYAAPIAWAVERGITTGTTETTFSPDAPCTQAQILTFLWRAAGSPQVEREVLNAVSLNPDFDQAIGWAIERGILDNADFPHGAVPVPTGAVLFDPAAPCTRGMAMSFLWRFSGSPETSAPGAFTDVSPNASYARAVAWAVETGITSGSTETTFSPNEICTRGQIVTFLYRCLNDSASAPAEQTPEAPSVSQSSSSETREKVRPLWTRTGEGPARSLGLDGSEFTSDGIYEAKASIDVYSPLEAVFSVDVPFPLYQACVYTIRFENPDRPGEGYLFTCRRWDEAFTGLFTWEGDPQVYTFTDMSGKKLDVSFRVSEAEDDRSGGAVKWKLTFENGGLFSYDMLESYELSCDVNSNL